MSTINQAHIRESPPVRDRCPNHWATPLHLNLTGKQMIRAKYDSITCAKHP